MIKKGLYLFLMLLGTVSGRTQTTFSASPSSAITGLSTTTSDITVSGIGNISCAMGLTEVCINITHPWDGDLDIYLRDPSGTDYELTTDNGGSGDNYIVTCFDMNATTNIDDGSAPFNGSYVPEGDLAAVNNGQNANGTWQLRVYDDFSDDDGVLNSWSLTFDNSPPCPPPPLIEDCLGGTTVCSDETFSGNSSGSGDDIDLTSANEGCLDGENESSWYYFSSSSSGDIEFTIVNSVDYDFAVWGPYTTATLSCPPSGAPLRCSYSGHIGDTGLAIGSGDNSEGSGGDAWVNEINASAGDAFILLIDNYTADNSTFTLNWTVSGGASLDCTQLPIDFNQLSGQILDPNTNLLFWSTLSELDNSHFILQRRSEFSDFKTIAQVEGAGTTLEKQFYSYTDRTAPNELNYYRLIQVDFDGDEEILETISLDNRIDEQEILKVVNYLGQEVSDSYRGPVIIYYKNGTSRKAVR